MRERLASFMGALLPGSGEPVRSLRCQYTLTPDRDFVLGRVPGHPRSSSGSGRPRLQVRADVRPDAGRPGPRRRRSAADLSLRLDRPASPTRPTPPTGWSERRCRSQPSVRPCTPSSAAAASRTQRESWRAGEVAACTVTCTASPSSSAVRRQAAHRVRAAERALGRTPRDRPRRASPSTAGRGHAQRHASPACARLRPTRRPTASSRRRRPAAHRARKIPQPAGPATPRATVASSRAEVALDGLLERRREQLVLGLEVIEDQRGAHTERLRHVGHPGGGKAPATAPRRPLRRGSPRAERRPSCGPPAHRTCR